MGPDPFRQGIEEARGVNREEEQGGWIREKKQGWIREKDQGGRSQEQQALTLRLFGVWAFPRGDHITYNC